VVKKETRSWTVSFLRSQKGPDDCEEEFINRVRSDKEFLDELMKHVRRDAMQKGQDGIKPWLDKFAYLNHFDLIAKCIEYLGAEPGTDTDKMDNLDQALRAVYDNYGAQLEPGSVKNIFSALLCNAKEKVKKDRAPIQSAEVGQRTVDVSVGQPQAQNACDQLIDSEMFDNLLNTESVWEAVCKDSSLIQDILDNDVGLKKVWEHPRALKSVFNDTSSMAAVFKNPQASARVAKDEDMVAAIKDKPELIDHLVEAEPNNPLRQQIAQELIDEGFESGGEDAVDDQVHGGNDQIRYDAWDKDQTCAKANRFFKPDQYEEKKRASTTKIIDTLKEAQPWFRFLSERNQVIFACQTALLVAQAGSDDLPSVTPQSVM
jgi:hypothetical protein